MPRAVRPTLSDRQRALLEKWSRGGSTPYRLVIRSRIVLLAAQGYSNRAIARRLRINPLTVSRWRSRFLVLKIGGIRHEAPRLGSPPRVSETTVQAILRKTLYERPPESARWSTRSLARSVGVSHRTVGRIWRAYDVRPSRSRVALLARDSRLLPKSIDVVGVYANPPRRALALSLHSQDFSRREPADPNRARPSATSIRSKHPWMADLISTLSLLDGGQLKGSAQCHQDREFLSFLQLVGRRRKSLERILLFTESSGVTTSALLQRWLKRHPEFSTHEKQEEDMPLGHILADWIGNSAAHTHSQTLPGSLPVLKTAVNRWIRQAAEEPRPFAWTRR